MSPYQGKREDQVAFSTVMAYTALGLLYVLMIGAYLYSCARVTP